MRCLIVDDDESPRVLIERLVAQTGHRAVGVEDAAAATAAVEAEIFDVAIVDLELPGHGGAHLIARLRERVPAMRVLVVSGYSDPRHVLAALSAGADGYLLKDELHDSLLSALQDLRAGHAPLSPRVASVVLRKWRGQGSAAAASPQVVARMRR
jgi:DNA-binding NarL/FixJ family response regulator